MRTGGGDLPAPDGGATVDGGSPGREPSLLAGGGPRRRGGRPRRWGRLVASPLLAAFPLVAGCGLVGGTVIPHPPSPLAFPPPGLVGPSFAVSADRDPSILTPPPRGVVEPLDPILDAPWTADPRLEAEVERWAGWWAGSRWFPAYLQRMGRYEERVVRVLEERGLPVSLRFLPIIESGYSPTAVSRVGATGMWQFMSPTARLLGLQVNPVVDERRDPFRATGAAVEYLATLHDRFGSWPLALAAYNGGPARVGRLLRRHAPAGGDPDSLFQVIRPYLPRETREFVPRFLAAARVATDPVHFGVVGVEADPPVAFDEVVVPDATTLDVVARAAGVPPSEIERLNPQLVRGLTPAGVTTRLRVPAERGAAFERAFARIPPEERVTFLVHRVEEGEILGRIAERYGVRVADLRAANPRVDPRRLQIGQRLVVVRAPSTAEARWAEMVQRAATGSGPNVESPPRGGSARRTTPAGAGDGHPSAGDAHPSAGGEHPTAGDRVPAVEADDGVGSPRSRGPLHRIHEVGAGETLWGIARAYWVTVEEIREWNGLGEGALLHPGDTLEIRAVGLVPHTVVPGETLAGLARRHGVGVGELARWNALTPASRLASGSEVLVPGGS